MWPSATTTEFCRNRPVKIEAEGKGNHLSGKQITSAYQRAIQAFEAKMLKDGLNAAEADVFLKQARANGNISSVQGAAEEYAARKEQKAREQAERSAAYRAWRVEEATYIPPSQPAPDLQAGLQALYEGRKAGEAQLEDIACTPENIQRPFWQRVKEEIVALALLQNYNDPIKNLKEDSPSLIESWLTDKKALQWMEKAKGLPPTDTLTD